MASKKQKEEEFDFLQGHKEELDVLGFWNELPKSVVAQGVESIYKRYIIRDYFIQDIVPNGNEFLIKWQRRMQPLTQKELTERYGK